jgi:hypothetical protein
MTYRRFVIAFASLATLASTAAFAGDGTNSGRALKNEMDGPSEAPVPGDADGSGRAEFRVNKETGEICYKLRVKDIDPAVAAHIHRGAPGVAGPVVVPLDPPTNGRSEACAIASMALATEIKTFPERFYVNVHNPAFPRGAVRGQLQSHDHSDH